MVVERVENNLCDVIVEDLSKQSFFNIRGFMDRDIISLIFTGKLSICMITTTCDDIENAGLDKFESVLKTLYEGFLKYGSVRLIDLKGLKLLNGYTYMEYLQSNPQRQTLISRDDGKSKLIIWGGENYAKL